MNTNSNNSINNLLLSKETQLLKLSFCISTTTTAEAKDDELFQRKNIHTTTH